MTRVLHLDIDSDIQMMKSKLKDIIMCDRKGTSTRSHLRQYQCSSSVVYDVNEYGSEATRDRMERLVVMERIDDFLLTSFAESGVIAGSSSRALVIMWGTDKQFPS